ncbi:MAG: hypothetical protein ACPGVB_01000 [Chitinophagales bacterium]
MIPKLRRRHKWMWLILMILLPMGFIIAYSLIPESQELVNKQLPASKPIPLAKIVSIQKTPQFDVSLREDVNLGLKQIEVRVKQTLTRPSTHLYVSDKTSKEIEEALFLGILETKGAYRFNLNPAITYQNAFVLLFYDKIAGEIYEEVQLKKTKILN